MIPDQIFINTCLFCYLGSWEYWRNINYPEQTIVILSSSGILGRVEYQLLSVAVAHAGQFFVPYIYRKALFILVPDAILAGGFSKMEDIE